MELKKQGIKCRIFWDAESVIKKTLDKIKEAKSTKETQYYAQDILLEAETPLSCSTYDMRNPECLNCHTISRRYIREYKDLAKSQLRKIAKRY